MNFRACTCGIVAQGKVSDLPNPKQEGDQSDKGLPGQPSASFHVQHYCVSAFQST